MKTKQETFDEVARALLSQGGPSMKVDREGQSGRCMYRAENGRKCAAGWLIPDELYNQRHELVTVASSPGLTKIIEDQGYDIEFVQQLQRAHDLAAMSSDINSVGYFAPDEVWMVSWKEKMTNIADEHALSLAVFDGLEL